MSGGTELGREGIHMKNLKIGKKLFITFGIVLLFFAVTVITALSCMGVLSSNFTTFYYGPYTVAAETINMRANMQEAEKYLVKSCTSIDPKTTQQNIEECKAALDRLKAGYETMSTNFTGEMQLIEEYAAKMDSTSALKDRIFDFSGKNQNTEALNTYNQQYAPILVQARELLNQIEEASALDADNFYRQGSSMQKVAFALVGIFAGVSLLIILVLSVYIVRSIIKPIQEIEQAADRMADGDLDVEIQYQSKDELGMLADSMRQMISVLRSYIQKIAKFSSRSPTAT